MKIHETRSSNINDVIVSIDNIRRLGHFFLDLSSKNADDDKSAVEFKVNCDDGSYYSSSTLDIFDEDSPILLKRSTSIQLSISSYCNNSYAKISLYHGSLDQQSRLIVSGDDTNWVNGTHRLGQEIVSSLKPQNNFLNRFRAPVLLVFALSCGTIMFQVIFKVLTLLGKIQSKTVSTDTEIPFTKYFIAWSFVAALGYTPAMILFEKLKALWPNVELQIGPEHQWVESKRRLWLSTAFLVGVAPILAESIYSFITMFIMN